MDYKVRYSKRSEKDLEKLDPNRAKFILKKISHWSKKENPEKFLKKLKGFETTTYRLRLNDYRAIIRYDERDRCFIILVVLRILHRKDVYKAQH